MTNQITLKEFIKTPGVEERIQEVLKDRAQQFIVSLLSVAATNDSLAKCEPKSLMNAAMVAASLDLPINQNLGFAYIIPYGAQAQFQMGYKGFIQLAQRSGQFRTINVTDVREGEITSTNRLTGKIEWNWIEGKMVQRNEIPIIGYVAYIELLNGFEKTLYMTVEELKAHGLKYSQTMKKGYGKWKEDFDSMAKKTVVKLLLSKYAPLTIEMQTAQLADQAVVTDDGFKYVDNAPIVAEDVAKDKEKARIQKHITESKTVAELEKCKEHIDDEETKKLYQDRLIELEFDTKIS